MRKELFNKKKLDLDASPTLVLFKKTFFKNVCTLPKFLVSLFFMIFIPLIFLLTFNVGFLFTISLVSLLGFTVLTYTFTLIFSLIIIFLTGPLISTEIYSGTILSLISKPISRIRIFFGKFATIIIFGTLLITSSLGILILISILKYPFIHVFEFFIIHFLYGMVLLCIIGFISMAFSSIFKKPRNASLLPAIIVILIFFVLLSFRPFFMMPFGPENEILYEKFQLYHFDFGYHMINVYAYFVEIALNGIPMDMEFMLQIWGLYKYNEITWEMERTNYYHPIASLILLLIIATTFLILGILRFKKRDISL
jgi:ABC-type transport system involved in multi-copper enzyme maturation permease subunit